MNQVRVIIDHCLEVISSSILLDETQNLRSYMTVQECRFSEFLGGSLRYKRNVDGTYRKKQEQIVCNNPLHTRILF